MLQMKKSVCYLFFETTQYKTITTTNYNFNPSQRKKTIPQNPVEEVASNDIIVILDEEDRQEFIYNDINSKKYIHETL